MQTNTRARRNLLESPKTKSKPNYTSEQLEAIANYQAAIKQHLAPAEVLIASQLHEHALPHLQEALLAQTQSLAIKAHQTPPITVQDLQTQPHLGLVPESLRPFLTQPHQDTAAIESLLTHLLHRIRTP